MVKTFAVLAHRFEYMEGANDVGIDKWPWVVERIVVVRFSGKVYDDVVVADKFVYKFLVTDVTCDEIDFFKNILEVIRIAGIG